jgi:hypothetical protein
LRQPRGANANTSQNAGSIFGVCAGRRAGGASGSFLRWLRPVDACNQPSATLCSESIKRFELEIALVPIEQNQVQYDINRNAQFRPHTDSGAGAGQSNQYCRIGNVLRGIGCGKRPGIFRQGDRVQWVDGASLDNALRENASVWCVHAQGPL